MAILNNPMGALAAVDARASLSGPGLKYVAKLCCTALSDACDESCATQGGTKEFHCLYSAADGTCSVLGCTCKNGKEVDPRLPDSLTFQGAV
jgi:hypothetical protein